MKVEKAKPCLIGLAMAMALLTGVRWSSAAEKSVALTPGTGRSGFHRARLGPVGPGGELVVVPGQFPQRVLVIRVDFPEDTISTTTGNGKFDLSATSSDTINPPPHDRAYFGRQMEALRRYYLNVSQGQVDFSYEVFPEQSDQAYTLPREMAYYSPSLSDQENDVRLAEFFRDAIQTADAADEFNFSPYDAVIIFHAGVGADIAFAFDDTPNDIPSAFMDSEWLVWALGSQYAQGVPVEDGTAYVPEGLWMPETLNQQDVEFALTGLLAKLFGHRLGLPNLYSSQDGSSGIGTWGLMDQGSGNELGLIPAVPCAWSRVFLGWEEPMTVRQSLDVAIDAVVLGGSNPTVVKVPITADEYFLVENRQRDVFGDGAVATSDGGVIIAVDEYDWGIPGSGLLIWHIDEQVIRENYESNTVNADPYHRGVDLEEADGFQDIGFIIYGGYLTYGLPEDAFYQGNNTEFTPDSNPNSSSYTGADSHIFITDISVSGPTMTCDVAMDLFQPGWPDSVGVSLAENPPLVGDLDGDGDMEIVINTADGKVFAWNHDGTAFLSGTDSLPSFAQLADSAAGTAALGVLSPYIQEQIVLGEASGLVHVWTRDGSEMVGFPYSLGHPVSNVVLGSGPLPEVPNRLGDIVMGTSDGWVFGLGIQWFYLDDQWYSMLSVYWELQIGTSRVRALSIYENAPPTSTFLVAAGTDDGKVAWWHPYRDETIEPLMRQTASKVTGLAIGDIDRDAWMEIIATCTDGEVHAWNADGTPLSGWPVETGSPLESSPALGDIDGDGYLEVVVSGTNQIWAWNYNGSLVTNFPITLSRTSSVGTLKSSPVLGDVDGDGQVDIVLGTPQGLIVAYDRFGEPLAGWPLACAGAVNASPTLADIDGDGDVEVLAGDGAGWMNVWDLPAEPDSSELPWPTWGHDFRHTGGYPQRALPSPPSAGELMPKASVYNYPNPTQGQATTIRYTLGREATVQIRIYDLSGDLVAELPGSGYAHTENEVTWDLSDVASGVYLCRVEARGGGQTQTAFCKIAVIK